MVSTALREFLRHVEDHEPDGLPPDREFPATEQEIGWWKQFQFVRAIRNAKNGCATDVELHLLAQHGYFYPSTPRWMIQSYPRNART